MKLATIPDETVIPLLRSLGLLIGQAGIYGPAHNVTQTAARNVFPELMQAVDKHGAIEITLRDNKLLVNGVVRDVGGSSGKNLLDRMTLHKVDGIAFLPPVNLGEFLKCVTLFGTPPMSLAADGGFKNAMKQANLRSVQVVNVTYRRVAKDLTIAGKSEPERPDKPQPSPRRPNIITLLSGRGLADKPNGILDDATATSPDTPPNAALAEARKQEELMRQQRSTALAALLRQAAAMLERSDSAANEGRRSEDTFIQIRDLLSAMTSASARKIKVLAGQVHADRQTIADIESAARRRGVGLQLTRGELITRYSEISQEIVQPLTVSTGVLDLLNSGRAGNLSESQRELLKMAAESIERVNHLVGHLKQISGMPESLAPDAKILKDAYK